MLAFEQVIMFWFLTAAEGRAVRAAADGSKNKVWFSEWKQDICTEGG